MEVAVVAEHQAVVVIQVAVEHGGPADQQFAALAATAQRCPGIRVDHPGGDIGVLGWLREHRRAHLGLGGRLRGGEQADAFVGAIEIDHLHAVLPVEGLDHPRRQRRGAGTDSAQGGKIELPPHLRRFRQLVEQRRRGDGESDFLVLQLPEEQRRVQRVVQDDGAALQGRWEQEPAQGRHVHQREGVQQHVIGGVAAGCHRVAPGGQPHIVGAGHALGGAGGARGPADAEYRVGVPGTAFARLGAGAGEQLQVAAEGQHRQARKGSSGLLRQRRIAQMLDADHRAGPKRCRDHPQLMAAVLHGDWRQDRAQLAGRVVQYCQFDHVGQLRNQPVAGADAAGLQLDSQCLTG